MTQPMSGKPPHPSKSAEPPTIAQARGSRRTLVIIATLLTFSLIAGAVVFVRYFLGPLVEDRVKEEARKRGVEMVWNKMSFYITSASFEGAV